MTDRLTKGLKKGRRNPTHGTKVEGKKKGKRHFRVVLRKRDRRKKDESFAFLAFSLCFPFFFPSVNLPGAGCKISQIEKSKSSESCSFFLFFSAISLSLLRPPGATEMKWNSPSFLYKKCLFSSKSFTSYV